MPDLSLGQCPHTLPAGPGPLFLLDPEREAFFDVDRPACRLLVYSGEVLLPYRPMRSVESDASISRVHVCGQGRKPATLWTSPA
jgi:hypothetical protein